MEPEASALELHATLASWGISAPVLLVGASYCAFTQMIFAQRWPRRVAGLVLVDPSHPLQGERALARLTPDAAGTSEAVERFRLLLKGFGPAWEAGCRQFAEVQDLGTVPMTILAAGSPETPEELEPALREALIQERHGLLRSYCGLSRRASMRIVEGSGHAIASEEPEAVIQAVREMLEAIAPANPAVP
jgi:pimeloyl-ACP methyl ester carboxylesterase